MSGGRQRVLHLIDTGGPGGAETVCAQVAVGLQGFGFQSVPVIGRDAWLAERLRVGGLTPRILSATGSLNVGYLRSLTALIRADRPALIITHLLGSAVYGSAAGILTCTPVITVMHGQSDLDPNERFLWAKAAVIRHGANRVVFVSEQLRRNVESRLGIDRKCCVVIPNGVDLTRIDDAVPASIRKQLGLPDSAVIFGAFGNLRRPKAYDQLLHATRLASDRHPRLRVVIAGDTDVKLYKELLALRAELELEGVVHFVGLRDDVPSLMKAVDAFVLSSTTEGFSIACCEAMAAGVPVLATRSGGPEQILDHGRYGYLVPPGDPQALAEGMLKLCTSAPERQRQLQLARARVEGLYSLEVMIKKYADLAGEVIGRTRAP